jgi:hypothetical protein
MENDIVDYVIYWDGNVLTFSGINSNSAFELGNALIEAGEKLQEDSSKKFDKPIVN